MVKLDRCPRWERHSVVICEEISRESVVRREVGRMGDEGMGGGNDAMSRRVGAALGRKVKTPPGVRGKPATFSSAVVPRFLVLVVIFRLSTD